MGEPYYKKVLNDLSNFKGLWSNVINDVYKFIRKHFDFIIQVGRSSSSGKIFSLMVLWFFAFMPSWLTVLIIWGTASTFWQGFAIVLVASVLIGWLQVILFIFAFAITTLIVVEKLEGF